MLVEKVGGPPVKVYQPDGVWEDATFGQIKFTQDHGEALYRRSLYIFWRRIVGPTLFFDIAEPAAVHGESRPHEHAAPRARDAERRHLRRSRARARRADAEARRRRPKPSDSPTGFRLCTARLPSATRSDVLSAALARFRQQYAADAEAAQKLIATGESKPDAALPAPELAAHTASRCSC